MPDEQDKYAVVQSLAQGIKQFAATSQSLEAQVEQQNQILTAMGNLLLKLCEALKDNNAILGELVEAEDDEVDAKVEDIEDIQKGITAMLRSFAGKRRK
jgi:Mg2+ and Co2+ transporter CorA